MIDVISSKRLDAEEESATEEALAPFIGKEIDLLYELPYVDEMVPAVYFIFYGPELAYVGTSSAVSNRLNSYHRAKRYGRVMGKWTQIGVMEVPDSIKFTVEKHYIDRFQPWFNIYSKDILHKRHLRWIV